MTIFSQIPLPIQIAALTEAFKRLGIHTKYLPFIAMLWGTLLSLAEVLSFSSALNGAMVGLVTAMSISVIDGRLEKIPLVTVDKIDTVEKIAVTTDKPLENVYSKGEESVK